MRRVEQEAASVANGLRRNARSPASQQRNSQSHAACTTSSGLPAPVVPALPALPALPLLPPLSEPPEPDVPAVLSEPPTPFSVPPLPLPALPLLPPCSPTF